MHHRALGPGFQERSEDKDQLLNHCTLLVACALLYRTEQGEAIHHIMENRGLVEPFVKLDGMVEVFNQLASTFTLHTTLGVARQFFNQVWQMLLLLDCWTTSPFLGLEPNEIFLHIGNSSPYGKSS